MRVFFFCSSSWPRSVTRKQAPSSTCNKHLSSACDLQPPTRHSSMNDEPRQQGSTRTAENKKRGTASRKRSFRLSLVGSMLNGFNFCNVFPSSGAKSFFFSIKVLKTILSSLFGVKGQRYEKQVWTDVMIQSLSHLSLIFVFQGTKANFGFFIFFSLAKCGDFWRVFFKG